jgi:hypothetical protein
VPSHLWCAAGGFLGTTGVGAFGFGHGALPLAEKRLVNAQTGSLQHSGHGQNASLSPVKTVKLEKKSTASR